MFPDASLTKLEHERRVAELERYHKTMQDPRRVPRRRVQRPHLLQAIIRVIS